jgi:hypothetical protein
MIPDAVEKTKRPRCKFIFTFLFLLFFTAAAYSQTVNCENNCGLPECNFPVNVEKGCRCFDGIDNDPISGQPNRFDRADPNCATYYGLEFVGEGSNCDINVPVVGSPFDLVGPPAVSGQNTADTQSKIAVGDVDGDGVPDVVITSKWNSEIRVVATTNGQADGSDAGDIKGDYNLDGSKIFDAATGDCAPKNLLFEHEVLIADIDGDGDAEIYGVVSNRKGSPTSPPVCFFLVGFGYGPGPGGLVPLFNGIALGPDRPGTFGIADMDGDGKAEIYMRDRIYAAETGALLATANGNWDLDITSGPVAVNISGDNKMELVCGTKIFSIPSLTTRNPGSPGALTLMHDMNVNFPATKCFVKLMLDPDEYGEDTHSMCSVADLDNDGKMDVVISGALNATNGKTAVFYWNVTDNTVSHFVVPDPVHVNGWPWGTSRVNLGDANGDGIVDLSFIAGTQLFCMTTDGPAGNTIKALWAAPRIINDSRSGVLTVTIYDFDNDGLPEMVYRDSQELAIIDGPTGLTKKWSAVCQSHTYTEGPVIADANGDGGTDICVACNRNNSFSISAGIQQQALGEVRMFYSSGNEWLPTRKVWNQPGYFVVNINDDLTLPFPQFDMSTVFEGECRDGQGQVRPMNVFLNQVPFITSDGCPFYPLPDLAFYGDDPTIPGDNNGDGKVNPIVEVTPPFCGNKNVTVRFNIRNEGYLPISASVPVAFYNGDPTAGGTFLYTTTLSLSLPVGDTVRTAPVVFDGPGSSFPLFIVLNNSGPPVAPTTTDCHLSNNIYSVQVVPKPFTVQAALVQNNLVCNTTDKIGEVKVSQILKGTTVVTDYSQYNFQWYTGPAIGPNTPIANATNYNLQGLDDGVYTVIATHKTIGCSSTPVDVTVIDDVKVIDFDLNLVSNQTQCSPLNGSISADFKGQSLAGVTLVWRDALSNVLVADNNPTSISGLKGDVTYSLTATRAGCPTSKTIYVGAPEIPEGLATKIRDVINCINAQSGQITAIAYAPGTTNPDPDQSKFDFKWYNFVNGARGSILAIGTETTATRDVGIGSYEVVITDRITKCTSSNPIVPVTVVEGFNRPTAQMNQVQNQTSCDPLNPNGILSGTALEGGLPAPNQSDYHFYWYLGQNTLTKLKDINGVDIDNPTLTGVKGGSQIYTVRVVHKTNDCEANTFGSAIEVLNYPLISLDSIDNKICPSNLLPGGSVTAKVTFAGNDVSSDNVNFSFNWDAGSTMTGTNPTPNSTTNVLINQKGGYFTLQVEQTALKCKSAPVAIQVLDTPAYPDLEPGANGSTNCTATPNGSASIISVDTQIPSNGAVPGYTFKWFTGATATLGNEAPGVNNLSTLSGRQGGVNVMFTALVTNTATGCTNTETILVPDNHVLPQIALTPANNGICDQSLTSPFAPFGGSVTAVLNNQNGLITDYEFNWNNKEFGVRTLTGASGLSWPAIDSGTYTLKVKQLSTGCESSLSSAVVNNIVTLPVIAPIANGSTNCSPAKPGNGSVFVQTVNGNAINSSSPFTFKWFDGSNTSGSLISSVFNTPATLQGGPTNYFTVLVTDLANGCRNTATVQLPDQSALPIITLGQDPNKKCSNFNGEAYITAVTYKGAPYNTTSNLTYKWFDGSGIATPHNPQVDADRITGLQNGLFFSATVTMDDVGCTSDYVAVEVLNGIVFPDIATDVTGSKNCTGGAADGTATVTGVTPADTYEFRWFTGSLVAGAPINDNLNDVDIAGQQGSATAFRTVEVKSTTTLCSSNVTVLIPDESQLPIVAPLTPVNNPNCPAFPDGSVNDPEGQVIFNGFTYEGFAVPTPYAGFTFIWSGPGAPAEGANIPSLTDLAASGYSLQIKHVTRNCISNPVNATVIDALVYPVIDTDITPQTSCDEANFANGQLTATATVASGPSGLSFAWFNGLGLAGTPIGELSDGVTTANLKSGDYTVLVHNTTTACASTQTVLLPDNITYPSLAWTNVNPVSRCDTPNGEATANLSNVSAPAPGNTPDFTVFYVKTFTGATYPTDPAVVKASPVTHSSTAAIALGMNPPAMTGLSPGYITGLVRDNKTHCDSNPETVEIEDATQDVSITLGPITSAGFCNVNNPTGAINVTVAGGQAPYVFKWYNATPVNSDINFYNNPPDLNGAPEIQNALDVPNLIGVNSGTYTLVAVDDVGCGNFMIESVPFQGAPVITINTEDVTRCVSPFDGEIDVLVAGTGTYSISIHAGNSATFPAIKGESCNNGTDDDGDGQIDAADSDCFITAMTLSDLDKGNYIIRVVDYTLNNHLCPLDFGRTLNQKAFAPVVAVDLVNPNTSCDPSNSSDGSINLVASKQSEDTTVPDYEITAITPSPLGFAAPMPITADAVTGPIGGFGPDSYTITVTDGTTGCSSVAFINIPDQPQVPQILDIEVTPDSYCVPATNGKLTVTAVSPGAVGDYEYTWYNDPLMSSVLFGPAPDAIYQGGKAGWKSGPTAGFGNGDQTYYTRGVKVTAPGEGCPTPIVMRVVSDVHATPQISLASTPNTSCVPNAVVGEGTVTVLSSTNTAEAAVQTATYTYLFNGNSTSGNIGSTPMVYNNLTDNNGVAYPVIATNDQSKCLTEGSITVQSNKYSVTITDNDVAHQLICDPDGEIEVTEIFMDRSLTADPNVTFNANLSNDFTFKWFKAPVGSPGTFDNNAPLTDDLANGIAGEILTTGTGAGQFSAMEAGTYYVIATRNNTAPGAGCVTPPYRVDVSDQHQNPTVALQPFSNTSCSTSIFEGSIKLRVTADATNVSGPFTYAYTWTPNTPVTFPSNDGDGSGLDGDGDNPTGLLDGPYAVNVKNIQTGCIVSASTTIIKNETPIFLTNAVPFPQLYCLNSGNIEVTRVDVQYEDPNIGIQAEPLGDFTYKWVRDPATTLSPTGIILDSLNYADISAGTYFVTATRALSSNNGPGIGCSSAPYRVDIQDLRNFPNVTLTPFVNTACSLDPASFEGSIKIVAVDPAGPGVGKMYDYAWASADPANTSAVIGTTTTGDGDGTSVDADQDVQQALRDDVYSITVTNQETGCPVVAETQITKTTIPVIIVSTSVTPNIICDPGGSIDVNPVLVGGSPDNNFNNFDFVWYREELTNEIRNQQGLSTLDKVEWPDIGTTDNYIFYVKAVRRDDAVNPDLTPAKGRGCESAPVISTIPDESINPVLTFSFTPNTSCRVLLPNATVLATAKEADGTQAAYDFIGWTRNGGPITLPTNVEYNIPIHTSRLTQAFEGAYILEAENTATGCHVTMGVDVTIDLNQSLPNILTVEPTPPQDCFPTGSAEVKFVTIGNDISNPIAGTDARFVYKWYNQFPGTPVAGEVEEIYAGIKPATYFVTLVDDNTGCEASPTQVVVDESQIRYPVVNITQTAIQVSCSTDPNLLTGELTATADIGLSPNSVADPLNFEFTWFNDLDTIGTEIFTNTPIATKLDDGNYSVKVHDKTTNCKAKTYYIIQNDAELYRPQILLTPTARLSCLVADGSLLAQQVADVSQASGYPYYNNLNYTVTLFQGDIANNVTLPVNKQDPDPLAMTWAGIGLDTAITYNVVLLDNNTGCEVSGSAEIPSGIVYPAVVLVEENPLINCDDRPNGQIDATADGGQVTGYDFEWYGGASATGTVLSTSNKLIGVGEIQSPTLEFTVKVTHEITGCTTDETAQLTDGRALAPTPTAILIQHKTRCDADDGWVTAEVEGEIVGYEFFWFDGQISNPDNTGMTPVFPDYTQRPAGFYTVMVEDIETGCVSPPAVVEVLDQTVIPNLIFETTPSYCEDVPTELGGGKGSGTVTLTLDPAYVGSSDIVWLKEEENPQFPTGNLNGNYITGLFPGWYTVDVTTILGCKQNGRVEVPTDIRSYNLVTQNQDNKNDKFVIDCISRFPNNNVKIFNRSGVLVYEADHYDNDGVVFDGIGKNGIYMTGNSLPVGTYFYIIDKGDGSKPKAGYLELVR